MGVFEEMMQMMLKTSKAKRRLLREKQGTAGACRPSGTSLTGEVPVQVKNTEKGPAEARLHLYRMPADPGEEARERGALRQRFREGDLKAVILEFPHPPATGPDRAGPAGAAKS
jgi:hypothetical protein